jgi:cobalt-zinc-cadmium resistance protein CzcA
MRKWIDFAATHSILLLLLTGALFAVSFIFVKDLNVEAFPDPAPPIVEVVTVFEGKSAEEVERQVTIPIEVALAGMVGLERLNTISLYGLSDVKCKFSYGMDYRQAKQEVINRLANLEIPEGLFPRIIPNPIGEVLRYNVVGSNNVMELRTIQDWTIVRHLKTADGVEDVPTYGGYIKAYNVTVSPQNLIKYGITLTNVVEALSKSNLNVGARAIEMGDQYYMVRGLGLVRNLSDIENSLITIKNGKPVLVKHIGQVTLGNIPRTGIVAVNQNDDAVMGTVVLRKDAQSIPSITSIHQKMTELNDRILPKGIKIVPYYERWDLIKTVVVKVIETTTSGIALVAIVLLIFLGNLRAAIITALVIPISLLITLALMSLRGESANLLSIGAIDFGIIADIPLVLMENYYRVARKQGGGLLAIIQASQEIGRPMIFSVMIILIAFVPIFMMKGAEAQIFFPMAKTYLYAILFTLVLTFTYLVAAMHLFLGMTEDREWKFLESLKSRYIDVVTYLLRHSRRILIVSGVVVMAFILIGLKFISSQFLPKMDEGNMYIRVVFPYSISLSKTYENALKVKNLLLSIPEVKTVDFKVGRPEDGTDPTGPYNSDYYALLKPYSEWKRGLTKEEIEDSTRKRLRSLFPNADINVSQYIQDNIEEVMSGVKGENSVKVFGDDLVALDQIANHLKNMLTQIPGIEDVGILRELGQPNFLIEVQRENAAALGLTQQDVLDTVSAALGGKTITQVIEGARRFALLVSYPADYRKELQKIPSIPIALPNGGVVALSRVANIHYDTGASFIYRENHRRYIPVKFSVVSKDLGGTVAIAQREATQIKLPDGYYMEWSGMFNEMKKSFQRFAVSIPFALFLILAVLYVLYGSVRNVFITMTAPVLAVFAGLLSLFVTGESLSVSSMVGFISIIGVSILNASIMISHYSNLYVELEQTDPGTFQGNNASLTDLTILNTIREKFRPILMCGFVAALGLLPASMAHGVGSQVQKPLAIVVVGGMLIGTALILLLIPLLLRFVEVKRKD